MDAYLAPDEAIALLEERIEDLSNDIDYYEDRSNKATPEAFVEADSKIDKASWAIAIDRNIIEELKGEVLDREMGMPSEDWRDPVVIIFHIAQDMYDSMTLARTYDARDVFGEMYEECECVIGLIEEAVV